MVNPISYVIAIAEMTTASSSIKETIDKVVSDTLDGMMEDTLNTLMENTTQHLVADDNPSNAAFQNKLPSSVDIAQTTSNTTQAQETEHPEANNSLNNVSTNQSAETHAVNDALVNQQNEPAQLNRSDTGQAITQIPRNSPVVEGNSSNSESANKQISSYHEKPANSIDDLIYKFRQLFFK
jgi:hypothetical protein